MIVARRSGALTEVGVTMRFVRVKVGNHQETHLAERRFISFATIVLLSGGAPTEALASPDDAARTLGFESVDDWAVTQGFPIVSQSEDRTQGLAAIAVNPGGWTVLESRLVGPLSGINQAFSLDVKLPLDAHAANPNWSGSLQLLLSAPSVGLWNRWVQAVELRSLLVGQFQTIRFALPQDVLDALEGESFYDLVFSLVFNVPEGVTGQYTLDNLYVASDMPPNSTVGTLEVAPILDFEVAHGWQLSQGQNLGLAGGHTSGNFSLAIEPESYDELTSLPLVTLGPVDAALSFDVRTPETLANPWWGGAVQLLLDAPSLGLWSHSLGTADLTGLPPGEFSTLEFPLSENTRQLLAQNYSDLRFKLAWSVPPNAGIFYIDNFQVGEISRPVSVVAVDLRRDLVGRASDGLAMISIEDVGSATPSVQDAVFYIKEEDRGCVPSLSQVCRYLVHLSRFHLGSFSLGNKSFDSASITAEAPFRAVIGGSHGMSVPIPAATRFLLAVNGSSNLVARFGATSSSTIAITPSGTGYIEMALGFDGRVEGKDLDIFVSAVADTPLVNRPPVADAGEDITVTANSCELLTTLDASASFDVDSNIAAVRWLSEGTYQAGLGTSPIVRVLTPGATVFTAIVTDSYGSESRDDVLVNATFPVGCFP